MDEWYSYRDIKFTPEQVIWILQNLELLEEGKWPPEYSVTGYTDDGFMKRVNKEAGFVKPTIIVAEVNKRLERTGVHGKLLRAEIIAGLELSEESKSALRYCSGRRRKQMSFLQWQRKGKYEEKLRNRNFDMDKKRT